MAVCVPVVVPLVVVVIGIVELALDAVPTLTSDDDVEDPSPLTLTAVRTTAGTRYDGLRCRRGRGMVVARYPPGARVNDV